MDRDGISDSKELFELLERGIYLLELRALLHCRPNDVLQIISRHGFGVKCERRNNDTWLHKPRRLTDKPFNPLSKSMADI